MSDKLGNWLLDRLGELLGLGLEVTLEVCTLLDVPDTLAVELVLELSDWLGLKDLVAELEIEPVWLSEGVHEAEIDAVPDADRVPVTVAEDVWLILTIRLGKTKTNACIGAVALNRGLRTLPGR